LPQVRNLPGVVRFKRGEPAEFRVLNTGIAISDPDGDRLTYSLEWLGAPPSGLGITVGPRIFGTPLSLGSFSAVLRINDGRNGQVNVIYRFEVVTDGPTGMVPNNDLVMVAPGGLVDLDAAAGGVVGSEVLLSGDAHGLSVSGTRVTGVFAGVGAVRVAVRSHGTDGATMRRVFIIAAPAPELGRPRLPVTSHVYDDLQLSLPKIFLDSRSNHIPLWDTAFRSRNPPTDAGATLGRVLFYDKRLSATNTLSCGSCHEPQHGFGNSTRFSTGVTGEQTRRNAMPLTNVRYNLRDGFFWDMRAKTLEELSLMPLTDQLELANTIPAAMEKLSATDFYPPLFEAAFGSPGITPERVAGALAQFMRSLISYRTRLDAAYAEGGGSGVPFPSSILTAQESAGMDVFGASGCGFCHMDRTLTSHDHKDNGLDEVPVDLGVEKGMFRFPSLRNVARSAPYMHDGRFATLREVVDHYDHGVKASLGAAGPPPRLNLTESDKLALEAFLETLTDQAMLEDPKFSDPFH
jgi:cytochrome c peroxidase